MSVINDTGISEGIFSTKSISKRIFEGISRWARSTSISEFSSRGCVGPCVRVRKLLEAELTITMKIIVIFDYNLTIHLH